MEYGTKNSLHYVISSVVKISRDTTGINCTREQAIASDFLLKNSLVSITLWNTIFPKALTEFPGINKSFKVYDFPSTYVLIRTLFEGYINMYYLLIDPISDIECEFRLNIWDRHALIERQKMGISIASKNEQLQREKKQIEKYTQLIRESDYFKTLDKKEQQYYITTEKWTKHSKTDLARKAGFHKSQSDFIYKFLSNYAHCDPYALMQIHCIDSPQLAEDFTKKIPVDYTEMILCLTLNTFTQLLPKAKSIVMDDEILIEIIDFWEELKSKDFKEMITL